MILYRCYIWYCQTRPVYSIEPWHKPGRCLPNPQHEMLYGSPAHLITLPFSCHACVMSRACPSLNTSCTPSISTQTNFPLGCYRTETMAEDYYGFEKIGWLTCHSSV
ncbi:NADH dehydrogenase [ubiquinone] 1 alpha subcomplex subunit 13 [Fusarium oxysporum f. sp. albedinis]|nr:NADH dehydrogenase [ubiquinone] 1 alpha subcomplex subunit 13 [Fusarium oxysporum f. sp. albedinis]